MDTRTLELKWGISGDEVSLTFVTDREQSSFAAPVTQLTTLSSLPRAIAADEPIATLAGAYQNLLRSFQRPGKGATGRNAMERLSEHFGYRNAGVLNIRVTATDGSAVDLLGAPWELLLYDDDADHLRERLARIAIVRTLGKTSEYSPQEIDGKFRVLLLQGAVGDPRLNFKGEGDAVQAAWMSLGGLLQNRISQPKVFAAEVDNLVRRLVAEKPHLLWLSAHGRQSGDDFELLFADDFGGEWRSISVLSEALLKAKQQIHQVPFVVAFWACEGARSPTSKGHPSLDSANGKFPVLVSKILSTGVEAVLGVQTQLYDSTARTMGESFFRATAEGSGPAAALALARADLHRRPLPGAPGSGSEWASPVLWTNGASMSLIKWASPIATNEALVFHKLGRESMLAFEGGRDIFSEPPEVPLPSQSRTWMQTAPIWLTCRDLHVAERKLAIIRDLRQLLLTESKTVLLIPYDTLHDEGILDAVARAFRSLERRMFPSSSNGAVDFLVGLFQAFTGQKQRDGWLRLLQQPELVIVILAEGGMPIDENLADAKAGPARIIVISNKDASDPGKTMPYLKGWKADDIRMENSPFHLDESVSALLTALAILDKPLSEEAITLLGRDFGLDGVDSIVREFMARFGDRYVVKASIARQLLEHLANDERRAAHRACMNFLERVPGLFDADYPTQLAWRSAHALKAGEVRIALELAGNAIHAFFDKGNYAQVVEIYKALESIRKDLRPETKVRIASAQIQMGQPQRAYDLIRQVALESIRSRSERLRFRVTEAEALRTLPDRAKHHKSIEVLEQALREFDGSPTSTTETHWWLIAKHDLARNLHYFRREVIAARDRLSEVVHKCGDDPTFAYTKAAALRNLSDIYDKYGYDQVPHDLVTAEDYLRKATEVAKHNSSAEPLLPELLYVMARVEHVNGRPGDAASDIREAIRLARERGIGRILALSRNKYFWWQVGLLTVEKSSQAFDYSKWESIEQQLKFASQDSWVARALVTSRVRAARCLHLQSNKIVASEVLGRAKALLNESTLFAGEADFYKRWQPVFAGLAVLNTSTGATRGYDENTWAELRAIGQRIMGNSEFRLADPEQLWKEVQ